MNRINAYLIILSSFVLCTTACKSKKVITDVGPPLEKLDLAYQPLEKALLWKIEKDDIEHDSYLFGTIHMIDREDYFLPPGTETAIKSTEQMVFEIDMDDMQNIGAQMGMLSKAMMKNGTTLKDLLSDEEYEIVSNHFKEKGLPLMMLERIKPMFLSAMVDIDMSDFSMGGNDGSIVSYEMEFYEKAQKNNMEVEGLETMDYQMSIFDSIPYESQADMLLESITSESTDEMMDALVESYKAQDIESLVESIDEDESMENYGDMLLKNRNMNWIPEIGMQMKEGPTFFAVGAGHLAGKDGVIHLLRESGYKLTPITKENAIKQI